MHLQVKAWLEKIRLSDCQAFAFHQKNDDLRVLTDEEAVKLSQRSGLSGSEKTPYDHLTDVPLTSTLTI